MATLDSFNTDNTWQELTGVSQTSATYTLQSAGNYDILIYVGDTPSAGEDAIKINRRDESDGNFTLTVVGEKVWARSTVPSRVTILQVQDPLSDSFNTESNSIDVSVQDLTTDVVDFYVMQELDTLTIANTVVRDTYTIDLVDDTNVVVGNYVGIQEGARSFQGQVISKNLNTITLDTPIDFEYSASAQIIHKSRELKVDGSVTPVIFRLGPVPGVKWHITRIIGSMVHSENPDDAKFGGISDGLTLGMVLRSKGDVKENVVFNAKTNGEIAERMFDLGYSDRAGGSGVYGTRFRRSFAGDKNGVVIALDGDDNDEIQVIVQDDLTSLDSFHIVIQGHNVQD